MKRLRDFMNRKRSMNRRSKPQEVLQHNHNSSPFTASVEAPRPAVVEAPHLQNKQQSLGTQDTPETLNIALRNDTTSPTVYAFITGRAIDNNNALFVLQTDGRTPYYPSSPSSPQQPLEVNCAIALGAPGNTVTVQIPHIAGGRIWFSINTPLVFKLNPGPALVEPSVTNSSDPNADLDWSFAEFTYNSSQLYANISYVDFVGIPVSLTLDTASSGTQHVTGLPTTGLDQIATGLRAQQSADNQPWSQLIVNHPNTTTPLRILSPNLAMVSDPAIFTDYFNPYINAVFAKYTTETLHVDTQASFGIVPSIPGSSSPTTLVLSGSDSSGDTTDSTPQSFPLPTTHDIFTCSTGPFATGSSALRNALIPRLAAAFNRSTYLTVGGTNTIPADDSLYYKETITNHYSRLVHEANLDGRGYAFPYDDVQVTGGRDMSGAVHAGDPTLFTVAVGGAMAGK